MAIQLWFLWWLFFATSDLTDDPHHKRE